MEGAVISLARFGFRLVAGVAVALVLAALIALIREDGSFVASLRLAALSVGCFTVLLAFGGSSPSRRLTADHYASYLFPKLHRRAGEQYAGAVLSDAAIFVLVGLALVILGLVLPS